MTAKLENLHPIAREIAESHLDLVQWLLEQYSPDVTAMLSHTWRSPEEQNRLYAQGRTAPGPIVTRARPDQTAHCKTGPKGESEAMGWDIVLVKGGKLLPDSDHLWDLIPVAARLIGGERVESGAYWKSITDKPHTELKGWRDL